MKNLKLLIAASIVLLVFLFFLNFLHIDIAPSKNQALTNFEVNDIRNIQNVDSAKASAIHWREVVQQNFVEESNRSTKQLAIVFAIIILQITLLAKMKRKSNS